MARKKKTDTDLPSQIAGDDPEGGIFVTLPEAVRADRDVLRWLHHWVVDAMADRGYVKWIVEDVEQRLGRLGAEIVDITMLDLLRQARAATCKPKESREPKSGAKRERK